MTLFGREFFAERQGVAKIDHGFADRADVAFDGCGQHGGEGHADRGAVVAADPAREADELLGQSGCGVIASGDGFEFGWVQCGLERDVDDVAGRGGIAAAEWDDDAVAGSDVSQ